VNTYLVYARRHNGSPLGGFVGQRSREPEDIRQLTIRPGGVEKGFGLWIVGEVQLLEMISGTGISKAD